MSAELARSHGKMSWTPSLESVDDTSPSLLAVPDGTSVRVQLLSATGYQDWPTEVVDIEQRYSDAPPARLRVLTADGFVAAKVSVWLGRGAPRDLYDLWALSAEGLVRANGVATFARHGFTGRPLDPSVFNRGITEAQWERSLAHQTRLEVTAREALDVVRDAWSSAQDHVVNETD